MDTPLCHDLATLSMVVPVVPTFQEATAGLSIIIEMKDGKVVEYENDGSLEVVETYNSLLECAVSFNTTDHHAVEFLDTHYDDKELLSIVQSAYPNVKTVYVGNL